MLAQLTRHWFLVGLVCVLLLSRVAPVEGMGALKMAFITSIFVFSGLSLSTEELSRGLTQWRLHLTVQLTVFVLWPLFVWFSLPLLAPILPGALLTGLLVLACLPTTVTSNIALVNSIGGNTAAALVNATLSNLSSVVITPSLLILLMGQASFSLPVIDIFTKLGLLVLLPLLLGQALRRPLPQLVRQPWLKKAPLVLLLGVVFLSFSQKLEGDQPLDPKLTAVVVAICAALHLGSTLFTMVLGRWQPLGLQARDRVALVICANQKGLALGLPIIALCFQGDPNLPLIALPILIYHPLQLLASAPLCAHLQQRWLP